ENVKAGAGDLIAAKIKLFQVAEAAQVLHAAVGHLGEADVERAQGRMPGNVAQGGIGDVGSAQVEALQMLPIANVGEGGVGDAFHRVEIQIADVSENGEALHAAVSDQRQRQVELFEVGQLEDAVHFEVGVPLEAKRDAGDSSGGIGFHRAAE